MRLAFERRGSGPPLVLLHGVGHRRQAWDAVLERLTPHRDVILVDLPGHGESPPLRLAGRPVLEVLLDEVVGLLDELALGRPHIAGNSLGGRLALEAAVAGRAATATALSPAGFWRSDKDARLPEPSSRSWKPPPRGCSGWRRRCPGIPRAGRWSTARS